jgi:molybdopterin/thiamine biosynthesis adenylyltransferase
MLTTDELQRYQRQIMIPGFGEAGQEKLKKATVFLAGAGGLGSPAALYLTAAGIGRIKIVDSDTVDLSNLNRQVLHWTPDIHRRKVESAKAKLEQLNPEVEIEICTTRMTEENLGSLVTGSDAIVDAVDNLQTRYLLNKASQVYRIPLMHGAVAGFEGRVMTIIPGQSACLMCLYRGVDVSMKTPVIGASPAIVAGLQVTEVIKYLTGLGQLLTNRFLIYDGLNMRFAEIQVLRDTGCQHCGSNPTSAK